MLHTTPTVMYVHDGPVLFRFYLTNNVVTILLRVLIQLVLASLKFNNFHWRWLPGGGGQENRHFGGQVLTVELLPLPILTKYSRQPLFYSWINYLIVQL